MTEDRGQRTDDQQRRKREKKERKKERSFSKLDDREGKKGRQIISRKGNSWKLRKRKR